MEHPAPEFEAPREYLSLKRVSKSRVFATAVIHHNSSLFSSLIIIIGRVFDNRTLQAQFRVKSLAASYEQLFDIQLFAKGTDPSFFSPRGNM
jgi:hypothetical protein